MKILRAYPKSVNQIIESIVQLPRELEAVTILNIYEISKNLPEEMLKQDNGLLIKDAIPLIFLNRYKANDPKLKGLCRKAHAYLTEHIP